MRLRNSLVIVETALALVLLAGAGLLFRSLVGLQAVDLGFETTGAAVAPVTFAQERYASPDAQNAAVRAVTDELASLSSVSAVGGITDMPLSGAVNSTRILRAGESGEDAPDRPNVLVRAITPDFLTAMGVGISAGRSLDSGDAVGAEEVAVVNEEFTRRFFGTEEAVGQLVVVRGVTRRVVGVAADVREFDLTSGGRDAVLYTPYAQEREGWMRGRLWFVMRGSSGRDLSALQSTLQSTLSTVAPAAIVGAPRTLESYVEAHMQAPRLRTTLILVFAALAVLMTAVGTGGVVAYNVSRRVPELGLRMALGAERSDVQRLVLKQTSRLAFGGVLVGLVLALGSMRVLSGFLFGIPAWDPLTLTATAAMLLLVATLSGWVPARRASRIDPATTLRDD